MRTSWSLQEPYHCIRNDLKLTVLEQQSCSFSQWTTWAQLMSSASHDVTWSYSCYLAIQLEWKVRGGLLTWLVFGTDVRWGLSWSGQLQLLDSPPHGGILRRSVSRMFLKEVETATTLNPWIQKSQNMTSTTFYLLFRAIWGPVQI